MNQLKLCFTSIILLFGIISNAQTVVNSLEELEPYLSQNNVQVKLAPGTYNVTVQDAKDRRYGGFETIGSNTYYTMFLFSGSGSTYDFTDVTLNIETGTFVEFGNIKVYEIRIAGNDNVLQNLTQIDLGSEDDAPRKTVNNIVMDGQNNIVDGFVVRSTGSYPYGYGDIFGKGGGPIVAHRKHSAILMRGESNTLRNTDLLHKAYGHCVFFQAAANPTVEGCHIEGEVRSSDDMLAEEGTGTVGDNEDFMTVWGYKLPPGFMLALTEAGIRAYNAGTTIINDDTISRGTSNVTVKNTTVKNTRTACTLVHASGTQYIENLTSIGNENGFSIGRGQVINCRADAAYGIIFDGGGAVTGDITVIAPENDYYNGTNALASVTGATITLRTETEIPSNLQIRMGTYRSLRHQPGGNLDYQLTTDFSGAELYNHTNATIELGSGSENNDIHTCGAVVDNGSGNEINELEDCEIISTCGNFNAEDNIEAECYDNMEGVEIQGESVAYIEHDDWISFSGLDLSGMNALSVNASSQTAGGNIELRLGSETGTLIGSIDIESTGNWATYQTFSSNIDRVNGVQDLYLVFKGSAGYLFNLDFFSFSEDVVCDVSPSHIEAECYDDMSGIQTEDCSEGTLNVGWIHDSDWLQFDNIDLTNMNSIKARTAGFSDNSTIEVRLDAVDGSLIGELAVTNTDGPQNWTTDSTNTQATSGTHDVFLIFKGGAGYLFNINSFEFSEDESIITNVSDNTLSKVTVYPNPTSDLIHFSSQLKYEITNSLGSPILSGEGTEVDLRDQKQGVYFLKHEHQGHSAIVKIIKK